MTSTIGRVLAEIYGIAHTDVEALTFNTERKTMEVHMQGIVINFAYNESSRKNVNSKIVGHSKNVPNNISRAFLDWMKRAYVVQVYSMQPEKSDNRILLGINPELTSLSKIFSSKEKCELYKGIKLKITEG